MSKIKDATHFKMPRPPFAAINCKKKKMEIRATADEIGRITSFIITVDGEEKTFSVEDLDIESAWKKAEAFINKTCK